MRLLLEMWSHPWSCLEKQATESDILQFAFNKLHASVAPPFQPPFEVWSCRSQWGYRSFLLTEPQFCSGIHVLTLSPRGRPNQHKENFIFFVLFVQEWLYALIPVQNRKSEHFLGKYQSSKREPQKESVSHFLCRLPRVGILPRVTVALLLPAQGGSQHQK